MNGCPASVINMNECPAPVMPHLQDLLSNKGIRSTNTCCQSCQMPKTVNKSVLPSRSSGAPLGKGKMQI